MLNNRTRDRVAGGNAFAAFDLSEEEEVPQPTTKKRKPRRRKRKKKTTLINGMKFIISMKVY